MTSVLARFGHVETRTVVQTIWRPGKRKREGWGCGQCQARQRPMQRRGYGDDSSDLRPEQYLFPPREDKTHDTEHSIVSREFRGPPRGRPQFSMQSRWHKEDDVEENDAETNFAADEGASPARARWPGDRTESQESALNGLWEQFEQVEDAGANSQGDVATNRDVVAQFSVDESAHSVALHPDRDTSLLNLDYAAVLPQALQRKEVDLTARCLFTAARADDRDFFRSMTPETFSEALKVLEPANFIDKLASAHLEVSDAIARQLGVASMHRVAYEYATVVREVLALRRSTGARLTIADYAILLRGARDLGDRGMSQRLWKRLIEDGGVPNTECYNYHMAGSVFHASHAAQARQRLRIIPFHMMARSAARLGHAFRTFRISKSGLKDTVMAVFREMLKNGAAADEESFRIVITAAAREGDLTTVKSVLRRAWNVDVDGLLAGKDEAEILPKQMALESPLRPTPKLLFTLAQAFGINNDIPVALRLVDFVARHYNLTISRETWAQLFEWTFVLSVPRVGVKARTDGSKTGQLPLQSVMSLWETMCGAPYFIQPTAGMYNILIKNLMLRDMSPALIEKMEEGQQFHRDARAESKSLWVSLKKAIKHSRHDPERRESLEHLRSEWEHAELIRKRNLFWCKRWLRLLLATSRDYATFDPSGDMPLREVPRLLWSWRTYAPRTVRYETPGGLVEFDIRTQGEIDEAAVKMARRGHNRERLLAEVPRYVGQRWAQVHRERLPKRMRDIEDVQRQLQHEQNVVERTPSERNDGRTEEVGALFQEVKEAMDKALDRR